MSGSREHLSEGIPTNHLIIGLITGKVCREASSPRLSGNIAGSDWCHLLNTGLMFSGPDGGVYVPIQRGVARDGVLHLGSDVVHPRSPG